MDLQWERSEPFTIIDKMAASRMFSLFDGKLCVNSLRLINSGCRNTNYCAGTDKGDFLLRLFAKPEAVQNEKAAYSLLKSVVRIPALYFSGKSGGTGFMIYEYVPGLSLAGKNIGKNILIQAAKSAANIHNFKGKSLGGFEKTNYPPYETWYDLFLGNENVHKRLGADTALKVSSLVKNNKSLIAETDAMKSLIHSDFRPANMLEKEGALYITDWEYSGLGHSLADIGQFFRYNECFYECALNDFEEAYNGAAQNKLSENWRKASKLRDLINPLQMLGENGEKPHKYSDLINIVQSTLDFFGVR